MRTELSGRIDQVRTELGGRIDQVRTDLSADQKTLREGLSAVDSKLSATNVAVAKVATWQRVTVWLICGIGGFAALVEAVIRLGDRFHWF